MLTVIGHRVVLHSVYRQRQANIFNYNKTLSRIQIWSNINTEDAFKQHYFIAPDTNGGCWATKGWLGDPNLSGTGLEYAVKVDGDLIIYEVGITQFEEQRVVSDLKLGQVVMFHILGRTNWNTGFGLFSEDIASYYYTLAEECPSASCLELTTDLDRNCILNLKDLLILADNWLKGTE